MKSAVVKRSVVIAGHKTSVSVEEAFWAALKEIAGSRQQTLSDVVGTIDAGRKQGNLSSAIRLFVLDHYQTRIGGDGESNRRPGKMSAIPQAPASVLRVE
jgi:predicted DNA-binding ribbon-helix-helix protein